MLRIKNNIPLIIFIFITMSSVGFAMNLHDLSNVVFKPDFHRGSCFEIAALAETGVGFKAYDECGCVGSVLRIFSPTQDALAMLRGFPDNSAISNLNVLLNATDDGIRGHFLVNGSLKLLYNTSFAFRYAFGHDLSIGFYLPMRSMRLSDVQWCDQTKNLTAEDLRVKEFLTNPFFDVVSTLGCLQLGGWKRTGLGDLTVMLEWQRDFPQAKPFLKNVCLHARLGLVLPTGLKRNEDLLFAIPFGADGSVGVLGEAGLDLLLGCHFGIGFNVRLLHFFGNCRSRRIKTDFDQTEFLLLQKAPVNKDWGLIQQFTLYFAFYQLYKGLSASVNYQFTKRGEDRFCLGSLAFSNAIANSVATIEEQTMHEAIFKLTYDWYYDRPDCRIKPTISVFADLPFNGKRVVLFQSVGIILSVDF